MAVPSNPTHIVMTAVPGYGHVRPLRAVARSLINRGYRVTFITGKTFGPKLESIAGLTFIPLPEEANADDHTLREGLKVHDQDQVLGMVYDLRDVFFAPLHPQSETLQNLLRNENCRTNRTIIIADATYTGVIPMLLGGSSTIRVPCIGFGHFPLVISSKDTAPFGTGLPSQGEETNVQMQAGLDAAFGGLNSWVQDQLKPYDCAKPFPPGMPLDPLVRMHDIFVQMCVPSLEPPRSDLPATIRFCGMPFGFNDKPSTQPSWWQTFVLDQQQSGHPLIVVTSGTLPSVKFSDLVEPTITACADLPVRLVVCAVELQQPVSLPSNARWAQWIPYEDLFPLTSLFVSSGGYGGVSQALVAGIPLVLAGTTEDKTEVNARAARTGAAINLGVQNPTVAQVKVAIETILAEHSYNKRAKELQEEYAKYDSTQLIVESIEELTAKFYGAV